MTSILTDAEHWRARAAEARARAIAITDAVAREDMLAVAAAYDRMAERAEKYPIVADATGRDPG